MGWSSKYSYNPMTWGWDSDPQTYEFSGGLWIPIEHGIIIMTSEPLKGTSLRHPSRHPVTNNWWKIKTHYLTSAKTVIGETWKAQTENMKSKLYKQLGLFNSACTQPRRYLLFWIHNFRPCQPAVFKKCLDLFPRSEQLASVAMPNVPDAAPCGKPCGRRIMPAGQWRVHEDGNIKYMIKRLTRPSATLHSFLQFSQENKLQESMVIIYRCFRTTLYKVGPVTSSKRGYTCTYPVYNPSYLSIGVMTPLYLVGVQTYSLKS